MGQEHSSQRHRRPSLGGESQSDEISGPYADATPVVLPPITSVASHNNHDEYTNTRSTDPNFSHSVDRCPVVKPIGATPALSLTSAHQSADHFPIADDPVIPFNVMQPDAVERVATALVQSPTPPPSAPQQTSKPAILHTLRPTNPHRWPHPRDANAAVEFPPIAQTHRAAASWKGPGMQAAETCTPLSTQGSAAKTFTEAEIKSILAIDPNRLIVIIGKNVYDVTTFADAHPGGSSVLRHNRGKDITETFFMMHSPHTAARLPQFLMGRLVTEEDCSPAADDSAGDAAASHDLSMESIRQKLKADPNRLILIMFGDAYDVTPMRNDHRGGLRVLLNYNGKECGEIFMRVHGILAKKQVHQYYMGRVPELGDAPSPLLRFADASPPKTNAGKPINPRAQSTRILEKEKANASGTLEMFTFSCPKPLQLIPGGHIKIFSDVQRGEGNYYSPFMTEVASFKVCIKHYADGRTSNFLFDQPEGKEIFFEGPFAPSWELQMDAYVKKTPLEGRHILLLAGGTGIAPMYSIAYHELEKQTTSVTLVSSVQTPDDLLLAGEMSRMQIRYSSPLPGQRHTLRVALAFSRVPKNVPTPRTAVKSPILVRCGSHIDVSFLKALKLPPTQAAVICGPPAFNSAMAKAVLQAGICPIECTHTL